LQKHQPPSIDFSKHKQWKRPCVLIVLEVDQNASTGRCCTVETKSGPQNHGAGFCQARCYAGLRQCRVSTSRRIPEENPGPIKWVTLGCKTECNWAHN